MPAAAAGTGELVIRPYTEDDDLVAAVQADGRPRARVRQWTGIAVVLGRGSDPAIELRVGACLADGVPVYRRRGGGCSVVLDPGTLILATVVPLPGLGRVRAAMQACTAWALDLVARCGIAEVVRQGTSDLAIGERKIGGSSLHRVTGLVTYATTLLVTADPARIDRYLAHPPREPEYRRGRSHADFVGSLAGLGAWTQGTAALGDRLRERLRPPDLC